MRHTTVLGTVALAALLAMGAAQSARADLIFSGTGTDTSDGAPISAKVDFTYDTGTHVLGIVLTNLDPAQSQGSVLTNLAVVVAPVPAIPLPSSSGTIAITAGSGWLPGGPAPGFTLGQEWAYLPGGVASSGFGVGTGTGNLCGTTSCAGQALDGAAYGLVGPGTDVTSPGLQGTSRPYVQDSVTIDITLASNTTFTLADISNVTFQYGTGPGEGSIPVVGCTGGTDCHKDPVPEPASLGILATALVGLGLSARRWRRKT